MSETVGTQKVVGIQIMNLLGIQIKLRSKILFETLLQERICCSNVE